MFNKIALSTLAVSSFALPAAAGVYLNVEANQGWTGTSYNGALVETHVGYEDSIGGNAAWYIQGGPAVSFPNGEDKVGLVSGKAGIGVDLTDRLNAYGEISAATPEGFQTEGLGVGFKTGFKYKF